MLVRNVLQLHTQSETQFLARHERLPLPRKAIAYVRVHPGVTFEFKRLSLLILS